MSKKLCTEKTRGNQKTTLYKKSGFPLRITLENATKSAGNYGFGHIWSP